MAYLPAHTDWYAVSGNQTDIDVQAQSIFSEALEMFKAELSKDPSKSKWITETQFGSLSQVLTTVIDARTQYETRKGASSTREWLSKVSERLHYYGKIMDVLVQHHPEYTSLAWGAMKVLFVGVVNHEKLLTRLAKGLCHIADVLPRLELFFGLYPTQRMRQIIVVIYAHILRILIRACRWFQESRLSHAIHAITRPAELRYDDLLETIASLSRNVTDLSLASSHAEQRDIHIEQIAAFTEQREMHAEQRANQSEQQAMQQRVIHLTNLVLELRNSVVANQSINAAAHLVLRKGLSEIQLSQLVSYISCSALSDPFIMLQSSMFMRNRRRTRRQLDNIPFWTAPKLQQWNNSRNSAVVILQGSRKVRSHIRDFCTDSIESLRSQQIAALWVLKPVEDVSSVASTLDVLKSLVSQAIKQNPAIYSDPALCPRLQSYLGANSEVDWLQLLISVLKGLSMVYIFVDIEAFDPHLSELTEDFSWPLAFLKVFAETKTQSTATVIKVIFVSYGSTTDSKSPSNELRDLMVPVGNSSLGGKAASKRRMAAKSQPGHGNIPTRLKTTRGSLVGRQGISGRGRDMGAQIGLTAVTT